MGSYCSLCVNDSSGDEDKDIADPPLASVPTLPPQTEAMKRMAAAAKVPDNDFADPAAAKQHRKLVKTFVAEVWKEAPYEGSAAMPIPPSYFTDMTRSVITKMDVHYEDSKEDVAEVSGLYAQLRGEDAVATIAAELHSHYTGPQLASVPDGSDRIATGLLAVLVNTLNVERRALTA